jgi:nicotinate phosphoribosyltransferase
MPWVNEKNAALLTDLYELTMAASYHSHGLNDYATFDLFVRSLPEPGPDGKGGRNFLVSCGLEEALEYLENLRFSTEAITYLRSLGFFTDEFLRYLHTLRFTGNVYAIPEGEIFFKGEPVVRVTAPLIEAQIVETFLLNCITYQTMVASKAARVKIACRDRSFVDFSPRRDHGVDAALKAARASYVAGASATSNVLGGKIYDIPVTGTMAHSYVMTFEEETEAFRTFLRDFPDRAVLLIDTFDVEEGARRAVRVFKELESEGIKPKGVRIDSGDLAQLARSVRKILDEAGLTSVQILASGDLDEYRIKKLLDEDAPLHAFGVGTQMGTSGDAPSLGSVYKLVADANGPKIKLSMGKATLPGCKQVWRFERDGSLDHDVIAQETEKVDGARPLLDMVMENGRRLRPPETLATLRERCSDAMDRLPPDLRSLEERHDYPVETSPELQRLLSEMQTQAR